MNHSLFSSLDDRMPRKNKKERKREEANGSLSSFLEAAKKEDELGLGHKKVRTNIDLVIKNNLKCRTMPAFKLMQNVVSWCNIKDSINPLWYSIVNKDKVKRIVYTLIENVSSFDLEEFLLDGKTFLAQFYNSHHYCQLGEWKNRSPNIWDAIFSTRTGRENGKAISGFQKREGLSELPTGLSPYEKDSFHKYSTYLLSQEELRDNLYPVPEEEQFKEFIQLSKIESEEKTLRKLLFGIDCEMVVTTAGYELARITIVDIDYKVIYDQYVLPENNIVDYNTRYSGITAEILSSNTKNLAEVQSDLLKIIDKESILFGHSLENDLTCLKILHERVVDTSLLYLNEGGFKSSLKSLAFKYLNWKIQTGQDGHDSTEDAKAAVALAKYRIEVIDNLPIGCPLEEEQAVPRKADFLENLIAQKSSVLLIDKANYIKPFLKYGIHVNEVPKIGNLEALTKGKSWITQSARGTANVPNIILLRDKFKEKSGEFASIKDYLKQLDEVLKGMNEVSTDTSNIFDILY